MEKLHINVSAEGIRALDHLSAALNDMNGQMLLTLRQLREAFEDNAPGLGAHTAKIKLVLDELEDLAAKAAQNNQKLAKNAARAAAIRRGLVEESPYRKTEKYEDNQYLLEALGQLYDDLAQQGIRQGIGPQQRGQWLSESLCQNHLHPNRYLPRSPNQAAGDKAIHTGCV